MTTTKVATGSRRGATILVALALVLMLFAGQAAAQPTEPDGIPPTVTERAPGDTAQPADSVTATFSEPMDSATINGSTFTLTRDGAEAPVEGSVSYAGEGGTPANTATLTPGDDLVEGATYTANISTDATDATGTPLDSDPDTLDAQPETWSFTVADVTDPTLSVETGPANGDTFGPDSTQTWTFSASDAVSGISTVECSVVSGPTPDFGPCSDTGSHTVSDLPGGSHTFSVRATDNAGNQTTQTRTFTIDATPPTVSLTAPADGAEVRDSVGVAADAGDDAVGGVEFSLGGATITDPTEPYTATFDTSALDHDTTHTVTVRAVDAVGNDTTASRGITIDRRVNLTLAGGPTAGGFTSDPAPLAFTTDDDVAAADRECRAVRTGVAPPPFADCTSPYDPNLTQDGVYTYEVRVTDDVGNVDEKSRSFTLDRTNPNLTINTGPNGGTFGPNSTQTWNFTRSDATSGISGVQCGVAEVVAGSADHVYGPCSTATAHSVSNKPDGNYEFSVRATDRAGNQSIFRTAPYRIDATRPTVNLTAPVVGTKVGKSLTLTATAADDLATPKVEFLVDGALRRTITAPPYEVTLDTQAFGDGQHTVAARSVDGVGNASTRAEAGINVDRTAPTLALGGTPAGGTVTNAGSLPLPFTVTNAADVPAAGIECRTYPFGGAAGSFAPCTPPYSPEIADDGRHIYEIRATDDVGNAISTQRTFTFDRTVPTLTLDGPEDGAVVGPNGDMTWTISGEDATTVMDQVRCSVTAANAQPSYGPCTTMRLNPPAAPRTASGSHTISNANMDGDYQLDVRAVDGAGNGFVQTRSFTVDRTPPAVDIRTGPEDGFSTNQDSVVWKFGSTEPGATFECRVYGDGSTPGPFQACSGEGEHAVSGLAPGKYAFEVRGLDTFGNRLEGPSARRVFTIDVTAPRVLGFTPKNRAKAAPTANVTVTFSEDMDAPTLGRTNFKLTRAGSTAPVAARLSFSQAANKATLNPFSPLQRGTAYKVTISAGARDLAGNPLAVGKTWTFAAKG